MNSSSSINKANKFGSMRFLTRKQLKEYWNITEEQMQKIEAEGLFQVAVYRASDVNSYLIMKGVKRVMPVRIKEKPEKLEVKPKGTITRQELIQKMKVSARTLSNLEQLGLYAARYKEKLYNSDSHKYNILYDIEKARQWLNKHMGGKYDDI